MDNGKALQTPHMAGSHPSVAALGKSLSARPGLGLQLALQIRDAAPAGSLIPAPEAGNGAGAPQQTAPLFFQPEPALPTEQELILHLETPLTRLG